MKITLYVLGILLGIIVLAGISGQVILNRMIENEKKSLFAEGNRNEFITAADLDKLPLMLRKHAESAGIEGKPAAVHVSMKQKGRLKLSPEKKWSAFTVTQYISTSQPGFIWKANLFPVFVRDKFLQGRGEIKVTLLGLLEVNRSNGPEVDQGAFSRFFGELLWVPAGFLDERISWEETGEKTVKGIYELSGITAEGEFHFNEDGLIERFTSWRYYESGGVYSFRKWEATVLSYKEFDGYLIPNKVKLYWYLDDGPFEWYTVEVTGYNVIS